MHEVAILVIDADMASKTIQQRHSATSGIVKAGELIEIVQAHALTLQDRRIMNLLIEKAGTSIADATEHRVPVTALKPVGHRSSERIVDSIKRLVATTFVIGSVDEDGRAMTQVAPFLSGAKLPTDERSGDVVFEISPIVRQVISRSNRWGRVKASVIFAFTSKYSLALYEVVSLRINMRTDSEFFTIDEFREALAVEPGVLQIARDFQKKVIDIAVREINGLSDYTVEVETVRVGGARSSVKGYRLRWSSKSPDEWAKVRAELDRPKVGRKARLAGTVENVEVEVDLSALIPDKRPEY